MVPYRFIQKDIFVYVIKNLFSSIDSFLQIEDLEISIRTLTKFNAELEATNKKQAAEIQELKRKLNMYVGFIYLEREKEFEFI